MKKNKSIIVLTAMLLFTCFCVQGQKVGTWKFYRAFHHATMVEETPNRIFAVYNGSLLSYSEEDQSVQTYSLGDGLNDLDIRFINYCPETKALLIVYDNSNMDIFMGRNEVYNLPYIKDNSNLSNKIINHVEIRGKYAYLATGFGIVVVDLQRKEIKNTYPLADNVTTTCVWSDYFYAATSNGLVRAPLSANMVNKENWEQVPHLSAGNDRNITQMVVFNDQLIFYEQSENLWRLANDGSVNHITKGACRELSVFNGQLVVAAWSGISFYTNFWTSYFLNLDAEYKWIIPASKDEYWVAWGDRGIVKLNAKLKEGSNVWEYETLVSGVQWNSPLRNMAFHMSYEYDKLLVTGGDRAGNRKNNPGTFMVYAAGKWLNMDDKATSAKTGLNCEDLMSAVIDPRDTNHYYVSSWGEGVYEFRNDDLEFVKLYSLNNSSLQSSLPLSAGANLYIRTDGMAFDRNNNLYVVNSEVAYNLSVMSADGKWDSMRYDKFTGIQPNQLIITRDNKIWINLFRADLGIFVLDNNGTVDNTSDDKTYFSATFTDQQGRTLGTDTYSCLAEDLNGTVWAGTNNGPITFSSAEQVKRGECNRPVGTDQYGEGYYILEGQKVTAIAVDGGNRKWIGTAGGGVFLVDQSEGLQVENWNTGNSLILSDNINSIAINGKTGEVFIATDRGICSYQSDATEGKPDYSQVHAFPNPVRPASNNQVVITGLMQNSRVKITDMAGNLIKEATSNGGQYTWNCTNPRGEIVKAGIYLVFATLPDGSQGVVTKIMVIK